MDIKHSFFRTGEESRGSLIFKLPKRGVITIFVLENKERSGKKFQTFKC